MGEREGDGGVEFTLTVAPGLEAGVYANVLTTWHTAYEFTLDFAAALAPEVPEDPTEPVTIPCRVVSRVKVPATLVFDVLRALNEEMTRYEERFGEIRQPGQGDE